MNLVVTRADDNIKGMTNLTLPFMKAYAEKIGADFRVLSDAPKLLTADGMPHYRILQAKEYFKDYERILSIDADAIVMPNCPDIFDVVPAEKIGTIFEDIGIRRPSRRRMMQACQLVWGDVGWYSGYVNTGCFVFSKMHQQVLDPVKHEYWLQFGSDDVHIGYNIAKHKFEVDQLDHKFNHMSLFGIDNRFGSHIIHYAGTGFDDRPKLEQIKEDAERIAKI